MLSNSYHQLLICPWSRNLLSYGWIFYVCMFVCFFNFPIFVYFFRSNFIAMAVLTIANLNTFWPGFGCYWNAIPVSLALRPGRVPKIRVDFRLPCWNAFTKISESHSNVLLHRSTAISASIVLPFLTLTRILDLEGKFWCFLKSIIFD